MGVAKVPTMLWLLLGVTLTFGVAVSPAQASGAAKHYDFYVKKTTVTRLCQQKTVLTVNDQFPGPTIYATKGDVIYVTVHNQGDKNITIHWHGVDQPRNPWFDGPEYITQCPIRPGASFTYEIILSVEEGTVWWHAHSDFDRYGMHGAIVVSPKHGTHYPHEQPHKEIPVILGEWWKEDLNHLLEEAIRNGTELEPSKANTINGQPGDRFPCSRRDTFKVGVEHGKTYLLRIINAGLTNDMFFGIAEHRLTVVGTDGHYLKPFTVESIMIAPGQTINALLVANRPTRNSRYYMAARAFVSNTDDTFKFNNSTATAILEYAGGAAGPAPVFPTNLPVFHDIDTATAFTKQLRSLNTAEHPEQVPARVDERMIVTVSVNVVPCNNCPGIGENRSLAASLNNVSFADPTIDILDAYYRSIPGVFQTDFPSKPPVVFNYTDPFDSRPELWYTKKGTKVKVLEYGAVVEVVLQGTAILGAESHPMHLHGYTFHVVGRGIGIFDENKDPRSYNLVDPPRQNTVSVPKGGWAAIRFRATNPGVWFMHCHFDRHTVWGMNTVFIVKDGKAPDAKMKPRPRTMPKC